MSRGNLFGDKDVIECNEYSCTYYGPKLFFIYDPFYFENQQKLSDSLKHFPGTRQDVLGDFGSECQYRKPFSDSVKHITPNINGRYIWDETTKCERDIILEKFLASEKGYTILKNMEEQVSQNKASIPDAKDVELF